MNNYHTMTFKNILLIGLCFAVFLFFFGSQLSHADEAVKENSSLIASTGKININEADANLIAQTLKGVGIKKAQAIVEYRQTYGDFANIHELAEVRGIGSATLEKNAHLLAVD